MQDLWLPVQPVSSPLCMHYNTVSNYMIICYFFPQNPCLIQGTALTHEGGGGSSAWFCNQNNLLLRCVGGAGIILHIGAESDFSYAGAKPE